MSAQAQLKHGVRITELPVPITSRRQEYSLLRRRGAWRDALRRRMLALGDMVCVAAALAITAAMAGLSGSWLAWALATVPLWLVLAKLQGLYDRDHRSLRHLTSDELPSLFTWTILVTTCVTAVVSMLPPGGVREAVAIRLAVVILILAPTMRALARWAWRRLTPPERVLIVGSGPLEKAVRRKLELFGDMHLELVGSVDERSVGQDERGAERLIALAGARSVERIILAAQAADEQLIATLVRACQPSGAKLSFVPPARGMFGTAVQLDHVAELPVVAYNTWDVPRSTALLKRLMDVLVSSACLLVLTPAMVVVAAAIRLDSGGPVFFAQRRAGRNGQPFMMLKFRTMTVDAEKRLAELVCLDELVEPAFKLPADPRVTRIGRVVRRWSLDELPQLLNVLRGDMSLVGPRPEQTEVVDRYEDEHRFRLAVKPGMTGPMQVYGRGQLRFDERLAVEREYVENPSLRGDVRILLMTLPAVVRGHGAF